MFKIKQEKVNNFLALNGEKLSGYEPPARIILEEMKTQVENNIYKMIQGYGISVDKEELIKALRYDRGQYQKGYADAVKEIFPELERLMLDGEIGGKYPAKVINPNKYFVLKKKYTERSDTK